jgi:hypothetical protein
MDEVCSMETNTLGDSAKKRHETAASDEQETNNEMWPQEICELWMRTPELVLTSAVFANPLLETAVMLKHDSLVVVLRAKLR